MKTERLWDSLRRRTGSSAVEIAVVVPLLFGCVLIPFLDLGCMGLRAHVMQLAARDGAAAGARCADVTQGRAKAEETARASVDKFTGLKIKHVSSRFVRVKADDRKVYELEVEINGEVDPLIKFSELFGKIPGLTASSSCSGIARAYVEHPENLLSLQ